MIQESLNSITTLLAEQLDRTADEPFKRSLAVRVDFWRSTLLQRSLEKHPNQRRQFWQTLWVPMNKVVPVAGIMVPLCSIAESISQIPIALRGSIQYDYIGGIDGKSPFKNTTVGTKDFITSGKYSKNTPCCEFVNYRLRVLTNADLPMARMDTVFDKPVDVMQFNSDAGIDCDGWDKPYPVTGDILQMIIQYILQVDYNRIDKPVPQTEVNQADANT